MESTGGITRMNGNTSNSGTNSGTLTPTGSSSTTTSTSGMLSPQQRELRLRKIGGRSFNSDISNSSTNSGTITPVSGVGTTYNTIHNTASLSGQSSGTVTPRLPIVEATTTIPSHTSSIPTIRSNGSLNSLVPDVIHPNNLSINSPIPNTHHLSSKPVTPYHPTPHSSNNNNYDSGTPNQRMGGNNSTFASPTKPVYTPIVSTPSVRGKISAQPSPMPAQWRATSSTHDVNTSSSSSTVYRSISPVSHHDKRKNSDYNSNNDLDTSISSGYYRQNTNTTTNYSHQRYTSTNKQQYNNQYASENTQQYTNDNDEDNNFDHPTYYETDTRTSTLGGTSSLSDDLLSSSSNSSFSDAPAPRIHLFTRFLYAYHSKLVPFFIFGVALFTRFYRLGQPNGVCFDESHFIRFTNQYTARTYFFDIHPPLGKITLWLMGQLVGLNQPNPSTRPFMSLATDCNYEHISEDFVDGCKYVYLRSVAAIHSSLTVLLMYLIARNWGATVWGGILASGLLLFDMLNHIQGRLVLLDVQLSFWTMLALYCAQLWWKRLEEHWQAEEEIEAAIEIEEMRLRLLDHGLNNAAATLSGSNNYKIRIIRIIIGIL